MLTHPVRYLKFLLGCILCIAAGMTSAQQASDRVAPEFSHQTLTSVPATQTTASYNEFIVVTAHPLASQAGYEVLEKGGSAIDAMVTVQTVLGLVEPQSSGLGGGAFALYYHAASNQLFSFDGRETAPLKAPTDLFLEVDQSPMEFFEAVVGGRSVGTPGTVKLLTELHAQFGKQPWSALLDPAIELAENGFTVSPRLADSVSRDAERLQKVPAAKAYFFPDNTPVQTGHVLKNTDYADTLKLLARHGGEYFYRSAISQAIVDAVQSSPNKGYLSEEDFNNYKLLTRVNHCFDYHAYEICTMGAPSSGGIALQQILGIARHAGLEKFKPEAPVAWQILAEASRRAFADRAKYVADPDYFNIPDGLLHERYLKQRSQDIQPGKASQEVHPGTPDTSVSATLIQASSPEQASTSHFVIVDRDGNILSMTSTIENAFGSRLFVKGFFLNNELTDFSFQPKEGEQLVANRVETGKRPRSSMSPTIVFHQTEDPQKKHPYLALGSPGGSRIINFVAQSLISVLNWQDELQVAFDRPHILNRFGKMELEINTPATEMENDFTKMGYEVSIQDINSGLHGVMFTKEGMKGAADKRREGVVLGK